MGLFLCYECKKEDISSSLSNFTNSSSKLLCSSGHLLQNYKKSKTFSKDEKFSPINISYRTSVIKKNIIKDVIQIQQEKQNQRKQN